MRKCALAVIPGAGLFSGCGGSPSTDPSALRLQAVVSPNPLLPPDPDGNVVWNVDLRASGSGTVLLERTNVLLVDASGARVGEVQGFFSRSAGCSVCSTDVTIPAGGAQRFSNNRVKAVNAGTPVRLVYTAFYSDDLGPGSTSVEVPVSAP